MAWFYSPEAWIALATLTALEIVLGIDNIIFITVLVSRLPQRQRQRARIIGLALAMLTRIALLLCIVWIMTLVRPLFTVLDHVISGRDLILIGGGLFLLVKSTHEIHGSLESGGSSPAASVGTAHFCGTLVQIMVLDIVFSLDSVITAVGLAQHVPVMVLAIVIAVLVMMLTAGPIGEFVDSHPTVKMLALSFLILIGVTLIAEGFDYHIPKGYIYFSMAFSVCIEILNMKIRKRQAPPVKLRKPLAQE
ncbi:MAG: TerC family protein [Deltaproteobacteria bacterium]|nr:TerC family protein [Deltaproteobacteria bacterium]